MNTSVAKIFLLHIFYLVFGARWEFRWIEGYIYTFENICMYLFRLIHICIYLYIFVYTCIYISYFWLVSGGRWVSGRIVGYIGTLISRKIEKLPNSSAQRFTKITNITKNAQIYRSPKNICKISILPQFWTFPYNFHVWLSHKYLFVLALYRICLNFLFHFWLSPHIVFCHSYLIFIFNRKQTNHNLFAFC